MNSKFLKAILSFSLASGVFFMGQEAYANLQVSIEDAKKIALEHAKITDAKDVFFSKNELDTDDGVTEYEIEFFHDNTEYDYEIDAKTGVVKSFSQEMQKNIVPKNVDMAKYMTEMQVKDIAMKHASLTSAQVQHSHVEFEKEDGQYEYQVDLYTNKAKYEYEINATTGKIIKFEKELAQ